MMHRTQLLIEDEQHEFLAAEARRQGSSISALVRRLISERMLNAADDDPLERLIGVAGETDAVQEKDHDAIIYGFGPR